MTSESNEIKVGDKTIYNNKCKKLFDVKVDQLLNFTVDNEPYLKKLINQLMRYQSSIFN